MQPDGKIVVAGDVCLGESDSVFCTPPGLILARFNHDGSLDRSFSEDGILTTPPGFHGGCCVSLAVQPGGRILATAGGGNHFTVEAFTPDGQIDGHFGDGGIVRAEFDQGGAPMDIAVLDDGRFVVAGIQYTTSPTGVGLGSDAGVARFMPDGAPDDTFAGDGARAYAFARDSRNNFGDASAQAVEVEPNGRIVIAGRMTGSLAFAARLESDGSLDGSFSEDGLATNDFGGSDDPSSLALDPDGRIVVSLNLEALGGRYAVARYLPDGSLDASFSGDGFFVTTFGDRLSQANDVALLPDGRIVVVGTSLNSGAPKNQPFRRDITAARFQPDGAPDRTFGRAGSVAYNFGRIAFGARSMVGPSGQLSIAGGIVPYLEPYAAVDRYAFELAALRVLDSGAPNVDADKLNNRADQCPKRFGRSRHGCPHHARGVRFRYFQKIHYLRGEIRTREPGCAYRQRVIIFRSLPGPDERIRQTLSHDAQDGFYFSERLSHGDYYAVVPRTSRPGVGICPRAVSPLVTVGGRS